MRRKNDVSTLDTHVPLSAFNYVHLSLQFYFYFLFMIQNIGCAILGIYVSTINVLSKNVENMNFCSNVIFIFTAEEFFVYGLVFVRSMHTIHYENMPNAIYRYFFSCKIRTFSVELF